jgi:cell division protein FtsQ
MRLRTPSPPPDLASAATADEPSAAADLGRRRRRATVRTRLRRAGIVAAVLVLFALATWVIGYSSLMTADQVRVDGVGGPLADTIVEAAAVPIGLPLARIDTDAALAGVASVPDVASATVTRGWPNTVVVTVTPRMPVASLEGEQGWYRVDAEGVLFAPGPAAAADLPILVAPDDERGAEARGVGVTVADALPRRVLRQVERIEAPSPLDVRLVLRDGRVVVWGSADAAGLKAEVLAVLLQTPATEYDVSVPDRPTLRPVPGA